MTGLPGGGEALSAAKEPLLIALSSSALFDLSESDLVFRTRGARAYAEYQRSREGEPYQPGLAFSFARRLLSLNGPSGTKPRVELVLLSRNSPETGMRVFHSLRCHCLNIHKAVFSNGRPVHPYIAAFGARIFLSANPSDVAEARACGFPAGLFLPGDGVAGTDDGEELRVAFDFDGVLGDDSSERYYRAHGEDLQVFLEHEAALARDPLPPGPLQPLFAGLAALRNSEPPVAVRLCLVTARSGPAHQRVMATLRSWGLEMDEAIFLGGGDKTPVLRALRPHIFFDDQEKNLGARAFGIPSVWIPMSPRDL